MSGRVEWRDHGLAEIFSRVTKAGGLTVRVGVVGDKANEPHPLREDLTLGEVAAVNEYGSHTKDPDDPRFVPERSFLRSTFRNSVELLRALLGQAAQRVVMTRTDSKTALHQVGERMAEAVRQTIESGVLPENAAFTVEDKGHDHTLIHTGTLLGSIGSAVVTHSTTDDLEMEVAEITELGDGGDE